MQGRLMVRIFPLLSGPQSSLQAYPASEKAEDCLERKRLRYTGRFMEDPR